jgi:hypothetical protein
MAGVAVAIGIIFGMEWIEGTIYPAPAGFDYNNPEAIKQLIAHMPAGAFGMLLAGYAIASFAGGVTATLVSGRAYRNPALVTGVVVMIGGILNMMEAPHPTWFTIINLAEYVPFALLGYYVARK